MRNNGGFRLRKANRDLRDYDGQALLAASQAGGLGFTCTYSGDGLSLIRDSFGAGAAFQLAEVTRLLGSFCSYDGSGNLRSWVASGRDERALRVRRGAHNLRGWMTGPGCGYRV